MSTVYPPPPTAYSLQLLSHQTGLSVAVATAGIWYNIGSSISVPKNGILKITIIGHISGGTGSVRIALTRGTTTYYITNFNGITSTASSPVILTLSTYGANIITLEIPVLGGDTLQFQVTNSSNYTVYIDDLTVILQ